MVYGGKQPVPGTFCGFFKPVLIIDLENYRVYKQVTALTHKMHLSNSTDAPLSSVDKVGL
jgi:hypothetical protein